MQNNYKQRIKEEFLETTETLWDNEVQANLMVARILVYTAIIDAVFLLLAFFGVINVELNSSYIAMVECLILLLVPAFICMHFEGRKKWLKIMMLIAYTLTLARAQTVLTYNVTIALLFPTILSIRYYSSYVTRATAAFTLLLSGFSDFYAIHEGNGILDLNHVFLTKGQSIVADSDAALRQLFLLQVDANTELMWDNYLLNGFLPKIALFSLGALMCSIIASKGRSAIFAQKEETSKTERISTELRLASTIQADMLPNIFPAYPERKDIDVHASMEPAKEVGGDFYDFFMIDDSHIAIVIADVSGKGIPAALFMVIAKTLIKEHGIRGLKPSEVFTQVNEILCDGNSSELFVTGWFAIIDLNTGRVTYTNAGHNPPILRHEGKSSFLKSPPGFVLAALDGY